MFCTACGTRNEQVSHYCFACGTPLAQRSAPEPAAAGTRASSQHGLLQSVENRLSRLASTERLDQFSLRQMFSEVLKRRSREEVDDYFAVGTRRTTPALADVPTGWPKPWFFFRVLVFVVLVYLGLYAAFEQFGNIRLIPGLIMMGSLAVPLATVTLFFELNVPRNVSLNRVMMLVAFGGVVSLFLALIGYSVSDLGWLGASSAGIVEEIGKLLAVIIVAREFKSHYILNGLLFGAAVGAGFAFFESAGYAFDYLLRSNSLAVMFEVIQTRAFLTPFGHVAWTAIAAGALWRVKGDQPFQVGMLLDSNFLKTFSIPVVLHMIWDAPLPNPFDLRFLLLGATGWFVVFGLVQQGLRQIRDHQLAQSWQRTGGLKLMGAAVVCPSADSLPA